MKVKLHITGMFKNGIPLTDTTMDFDGNCIKLKEEKFSIALRYAFYTFLVLDSTTS